MKESFMNSKKNNKFRVDRTVMMVTHLQQSDEDRYWQAKTPAERLEAIEINRRILYGYSTPPRFQRLLEIARR